MESTLTDAELIARTLRRKSGAFDELVRRHLDGVYKFAYRYVRDAADAEDVAQETFVRAWKNLKSFDQARNFRTWIYTITRNAALDLLKKKKPLAFSKIAEAENDLESILAPYIATGEMPGDAVDLKFLRGDLDGALKQLPPAYRAVLALRYNDHLKFREIAAALGEPIDTVKSKHRRGIMMLRDIFIV